MATFRRYSPLPGFGLSLGYTIFYLSLIVLIPLSAVGTTLSSPPWKSTSLPGQ